MTKKSRSFRLLVLSACCLLPYALQAHRDTLTQVLEPDPLVTCFEAETTPTLGKAKPVDDAEASGGKAVVLSGEGAGFKLEFGKLPVGMHAVYLIAKVAQEDAFIESYKREVQVGSPTRQSRPLYFALDINSGPGGKMERHLLRVPFSAQYEYMTKIYFHTPEERTYTGKVTIAPRSLIREVTVDRVELHNPLGNLTFAALKNRRIIYTPAEIANLVQAAGKTGKLPAPLRAFPRTAEERAARDEILWNQSVMPLNGQTGYHEPDSASLAAALLAAKYKLGKEPGQWVAPRSYDQPWQLVNTNLNLVYTMADYIAGNTLPAPWPFAEDKGGCFVEKDQLDNRLPFNVASISRAMHARYAMVTRALTGADNGLAWSYLLTGDLEAGSDGAFLLAAYAYRFPGYDWQVHNLDHIIPATRVFEPGSVFGRGADYQGWSTPAYTQLIRAYDMLFPYIKDNPELAERVGRFVPWVKTPADVVKLIDTFLLQRGAQDAIQQILYSAALPVSAVVLGPNPVSDRYLDTYFRKMYFRNSLSGFLDDIVNGYSRDGLNYIGSSYYTVGESVGELMEAVDLLRSYTRAGGAKKYDVSDPHQCPRLPAMPDAVLRLHVAGGYRPGVGDVMDPQMPPRLSFDPKEHGSFYTDAYRWTSDPRYAWLLAHHFGQGSIPDKEWDSILKAAEGQRDPVRHATSQVLEGFGIVCLEEGAESPDLRQKNAVMLQTGVGSGHAHCETLNYEVYAHGLRMSSDLGGRASGMYGRPKVMVTRIHNLVEVDEKSHNGGSAENATGIGWVNAFKPQPGAQFVMASGKAESHTNVSVYTRSLAQIVCAPGNGSNLTPSAYVFDVFRVAGGKVHTWCFHGCLSEDFKCNASLQAVTGGVAAAYLKAYYPGSQKEGTTPDVLEATWKLRRTAETVDEFKYRNAEQNMLGNLYDPASPEKFTRVSLFGQQGARTLVANWSSKYQAGGRFFNFPFLHVRVEGQEGLEGVFPSVVEPYAGQPFIKGKRLLKVEEAETGVNAPVALEVQTKFGQTDFLFAGANPDKVYRAEGGLKASGQFGFISRDQQGVRLAHLVGGIELDGGGIRIKTARSAYRANVASVNYADNTLTLSEAWPAKLLDGEVLTITNRNHQTHYQSIQINGKQAVLKRTASALLSGIESVNPTEGYANLDVIPPLFNYHPAYYNGMTALTESGRVLGRASIRLGERFWYTGWPVVRRHLAVMRPEDIKDVNGDGRQTLTMIATYPVNKFAADGVTLVGTKPGETMLELEVTRVRDDGLMFWTRQHPREYLDSLKMLHAGWPYDQQLVRNEKGDKSWTVNMPGDVYQLWVDGKKMTDKDFDDPNRDGRRMVSLQDYGVGDQVSVPVHVYVRRLEPGNYEVRANAACELGLPAESAPKGFACSSDGKTWVPLEGRKQDKLLVINLTEAQLATQLLILQAVK